MPTPRQLAIHQALALFAAFAMAAAWLVPAHFLPWTSFYNEFCMAVSLALLALALLPVRQHAGMPAVAWFLLALPMIPWFQWLSGLMTYSGDAWVSTLYLLGFATAVAVGYQWHRADEKRLTLLLAVAAVVAASVSSAIGLDQALNGGGAGVWTMDGTAGMAAQGNLGQANNLATLIAFGAIGLLLLRERQILGTLPSAGLLALLIVGAGFTLSRTSLLYGPVIALGFSVFAKRNPGSFKTHPMIVIGAVTLHWLLALSVPVIQKSLLVSQPAANVAARGLETSRFQAWQMFLASLKESPWFGYGWLETAEAQFEVAADRPAIGELYNTAHNLFVELLVWCGYPLGTLLSGCVVYWFFSRALKASNPATGSKLESLCGMLCIGVLGVHSMLELPYHYAYFLIPAGLWMGVVEHSVRSKPIGRPQGNLAAAAVSAALLIAMTRDYFAVERAFNVARVEFERSGALAAEKAPTNAPLLSALTSYSSFLRTSPKPGMGDGELAEMRAVAKRYPYTFNLVNLSFALAVNGRVEEAKDVMLKLRAIHGDGRYQPILVYLRSLIAQEKDPQMQAGLSALEAAVTR